MPASEPQPSHYCSCARVENPWGRCEGLRGGGGVGGYGGGALEEAGIVGRGRVSRTGRACKRQASKSPAQGPGASPKSDSP
jgi:hypothetical protein